MELLQNLIGSLGFPIAVSVYLLVSMNKQRKEFDAREDRLISQTNETLTTISTAVNNNTIATEKLIDKLSK